MIKEEYNADIEFIKNFSICHEYKEYLRGELLHGDVGAFWIRTPELPTGTYSQPYQVRLFELSDTGQPTLTNKAIISLHPEHFETLLEISIKAVSEQIHHYQAKDYESYISLLINEDGIETEHEKQMLKYGSKLMSNEVNRTIGGICLSLLNALKNSLDSLYTTYIEILNNLSNRTNNLTKERFIERAIKQLHYNEKLTLGLLSCDLEASWLFNIIDAIWDGGLSDRASKAIVTPSHVQKMLLDLSASRLPEINTNPDVYEVKETLWLSVGTGLMAGLTPDLIEVVLKHHNQALIIDLVKLFTTIWNERSDVRSSRILNIPDRWSGLVEMLHDRYGVSMNKTSITKTINACRLLESLRWGTSWADHVKLISFEGLARNNQLIANYHTGFYTPLEKHERLVPILDHPSGSTNSRAYYNRCGLTLGVWLVENSNTYLMNGGLGVPFDEDAYKYFMQHSGFPRKKKVDDALNAFEEYGAIKREGNLIGLGEKNLAGERVILDGAKRSKQASERGRRSARKRISKINAKRT